jgi:hypothetical protein
MSDLNETQISEPYPPSLELMFVHLQIAVYLYIYLNLL